VEDKYLYYFIKDKLLQEYFTTSKETIFSNVEVLIYVFDVEKEGELY
jgi:Ras-related GTP-binding protein A/B